MACTDLGAAQFEWCARKREQAAWVSAALTTTLCAPQLADRAEAERTPNGRLGRPQTNPGHCKPGVGVPARELLRSWSEGPATAAASKGPRGGGAPGAPAAQ